MTDCRKRPLTRLSPILSPKKGERAGVRGSIATQRRGRWYVFQNYFTGEP